MLHAVKTGLPTPGLIRKVKAKDFRRQESKRCVFWHFIHPAWFRSELSRFYNLMCGWVKAFIHGIVNHASALGLHDWRE